MSDARCLDIESACVALNVSRATLYRMGDIILAKPIAKHYIGIIGRFQHVATFAKAPSKRRSRLQVGGSSYLAAWRSVPSLLREGSYLENAGQGYPLWPLQVLRLP